MGGGDLMVVARLGLTMDILEGGRRSEGSLGLNWEFGVRESEACLLLGNLIHPQRRETLQYTYHHSCTRVCHWQA